VKGRILPKWTDRVQVGRQIQRRKEGGEERKAENKTKRNNYELGEEEWSKEL
jgi:hypothetical protein